jgi:hypothetical protein
MEWDRGRSGGRELIDFASRPPSRGLEFNARLSVGAVTLTHCTSRPIEGRHVGAAQITAAIHDGATFDMDWRGGRATACDQAQSRMVAFTLETGVFPSGFAATRRLPSSLSRSKRLSSRRYGGKPSTASVIASSELRSVSRIR